MNNILQIYQQLRQNPMMILKKRFNIPDTVNMDDPNAIIQHLLDTNQVSQVQVNSAMQMKDSPMIKQIFRM